MKKINKFTLLKKRPDMPLRHDYIEPTLFDQLANRFPEIVNDRQTSIEVLLEENDLKLVEIMRFLERDLNLKALGIRSVKKRASKQDNSNFVVETTYSFDEQDVENAEFLSMSTDVEVGLDGIDSEDWDRWGLVKAARKIPLIGYLGHTQVCTNDAREELEMEGFGGLVCLPILVHDPRYRQGDFWRLWANRSMPKVAMPLCDAEGNPVKEDYSTGCYPEEIILNQRILKYRAADLASMRGIDFALTAEKWGTPKARFEREWLVVSQRFRQWCLKKNVKAAWTPVIALPD